eukprot:Em0010g394a
MAKRSRRMDRQEVLELLDRDDDALESSDEICMSGSDDEFSDLEQDEEECFVQRKRKHRPENDIESSDDELLSFQIATCTIEEIQVDCIEDEPMDTIVNEIEPQGPNQQTSTHIIMPEQLLKDISEASNEYAKRAMTTEKYEKWNKISTAELKAYLGFHILMSINRLPSIDDYWSMNANLRYAPVADRISRDRFRDLQKYLHFVDNDTLVPRGQRGHDRLGKEVAVDEAMIKFQGRSSLKQYMPLKPIKRGIKGRLTHRSKRSISGFSLAGQKSCDGNVYQLPRPYTGIDGEQTALRRLKD